MPHLIILVFLCLTHSHHFSKEASEILFFSWTYFSYHHYSLVVLLVRKRAGRNCDWVSSQQCLLSLVRDTDCVSG